MSMPLLTGLIGYGAALLAYLVLLLLVLSSHPSSRFAYWLIGALIVSIFWSGAMFSVLWSERSPLIWLPVADSIHLGAWIAFLAVAILGAEQGATARRMFVSFLAMGVACVATVLVARFVPAATGGADQVEFVAMLLLPLLGLLGLEQVARNAGYEMRPALIPLAAALGLIFVVDLFAFSQAFLSAEQNAYVWQLRGLGNAVAAPLLLLSVKRRADWAGSIFVSRQVVFHTASLTAAGLYLLALGAVGTMVQPYRGGWRTPLELLFFFAACGLFIYAVFSTTVHRKVKVFIAKHFYQNRYDYREEWLRLIGTLSDDSMERPLSERGVRALAEIIGSEQGELWLQEKDSGYEGYGAWNMPVPTDSFGADDRLVAFLRSRSWVIDTQEYQNRPEVYGHALADEARVLRTPSIITPLLQGKLLVGFVRLQRPAGLGALSYEDHDLLKTAGQQVAVFLAQERAQAELAETRQLEAFSKLTAFLMHDLKNLISQQELVVGNARRFKHRPDFIEDTIRTIESSVERMRRVLARLQVAGDLRERRSRVDLCALVAGVANACGDRSPIPAAEVPDEALWVELDRDKLASALSHAIRNAQDATPPDGSVRVSLSSGDGVGAICVADSGEGMDPEFVRQRLFKPFDSTKGAQGMGIGAYQVRETVRSMGGTVEVESEVGKGTSLTLRIPLVPASGARLDGATSTRAAG